MTGNDEACSAMFLYVLKRVSVFGRLLRLQSKPFFPDDDHSKDLTQREWERLDRNVYIDSKAYFKIKLHILKHTITVAGLVLKSLFSCLGTQDKTRIRVCNLWKRIWKADAN